MQLLFIQIPTFARALPTSCNRSIDQCLFVSDVDTHRPWAALATRPETEVSIACNSFIGVFPAMLYARVALRWSLKKVAVRREERNTRVREPE